MRWSGPGSPLASMALAASAAALIGCPGPAPAPAGPAVPTPVAVEPDPAANPPEPATPGEPTIEQIRVAAIERAINETKAARHECWAYAAADNYHLEGQVSLRLTFGDGDTAAVQVLSDQPGDERLTACVTELYSRYRWPGGVFEPGMAVELPLRFQTPRYQHTIAAAYIEPSTLADGKLTVSVLMDEHNTGNGAGALSLVTVTGNMTIAMHRHTRSAELLYVRSGRGLIYGLDGPRRGVKVGPGHAIYIPAGAAHGFVHQGTEPIELVQLYTPSGPEARFKGGPAVDTVPVTAEERKPRARPRAFARPVVVKKPRTYRVAGGAITVAIYLDEESTGDKAAYLGVISAKPGTQVPTHTHDASTEILLVTAGQGTTTIAGDDYPTGPMTAVQIPAGIEHGLVVGTDAPVEAFQFYTPAGPEQRFKKAP